MNLTDDEIRIKVAEAMGWDKVYKGPEPDNRWISPCGRYKTLEEIPNYPLDLNACAEFEKTLTDKELWQIDAILFNLPDCRAPFVATARQRCLAYLKTKGILP